MFIVNLILSCVQIQGGLLIWHSDIQTSPIVLATFLVSVIKRQTNKQAKTPNTSDLLKEKQFILALSLKVQSIVVGRSRWQEFKAADHTASKIRT